MPTHLKNVMGRYKENFLPCCGGSVDVVHLKRTKCPAGDYNHCKGKEGYPSVAFEVITGYDRQIIGVFLCILELEITNKSYRLMRCCLSLKMDRTGMSVGCIMMNLGENNMTLVFI
jgi:hypothetical protein